MTTIQQPKSLAIKEQGRDILLRAFIQALKDTLDNRKIVDAYARTIAMDNFKLGFDSYLLYLGALKNHEQISDAEIEQKQISMNTIDKLKPPLKLHNHSIESVTKAIKSFFDNIFDNITCPVQEKIQSSFIDARPYIFLAFLLNLNKLVGNDILPIDTIVAGERNEMINYATMNQETKLKLEEETAKQVYKNYALKMNIVIPMLKTHYGLNTKTIEQSKLEERNPIENKIPANQIKSNILEALLLASKNYQNLPKTKSSAYSIRAVNELTLYIEDEKNPLYILRIMCCFLKTKTNNVDYTVSKGLNDLILREWIEATKNGINAAKLPSDLLKHSLSEKTFKIVDKIESKQDLINLHRKKNETIQITDTTNLKSNVDKILKELLSIYNIYYDISIPKWIINEIDKPITKSNKYMRDLSNYEYDERIFLNKYPAEDKAKITLKLLQDTHALLISTLKKLDNAEKKSSSQYLLNDEEKELIYNPSLISIKNLDKIINLLWKKIDYWHGSTFLSSSTVYLAVHIAKKLKSMLNAHSSKHIDLMLNDINDIFSYVSEHSHSKGKDWNPAHLKEENNNPQKILGEMKPLLFLKLLETTSKVKQPKSLDDITCIRLAPKTFGPNTPVPRYVLLDMSKSLTKQLNTSKLTTVLRNKIIEEHFDNKTPAEYKASRTGSNP